MFRLLALLGIIFGVILRRFTKDEIESGRKYFEILKKTILFVIILLVLYYVNFSILVFLMIIVGFLVALFLLRSPHLFLGLSLGISSYLLVGLIFLHGLTSSSLNWNRGVMVGMVLFIIGFGIAYFVGTNNLFLGFVSGGLFFNFLKK